MSDLSTIMSCGITFGSMYSHGCSVTEIRCGYRPFYTTDESGVSREPPKLLYHMIRFLQVE